MAVSVVVLALAGGGLGTPAAGEDQGRIVTVPGGAYTVISAATLARMLPAKDFFLVNVHVPYEGEIDRTDAFVPYDRIEVNLSSLPADRKARIVLYCMSGRMSEIAAKRLVKLGYRSVSDVEGGMVAWEKSGQKVITRPR
jgi:rhodanese-related sulfurtransferase